MYTLFDKKTLLITGGTGSFGNAVLEKFLNSNIHEIRIFSRDEKKQDDMRKKYKNDKIKFYIGDVRDYLSIIPAMTGVDFVFHAAALKQVPSCEFFPLEAVKTNILGTDNVLNAAINCKVNKVVCLSTDKAAYPVNAMGISKAMMEKVFIAKSRTHNLETIICGTRYGNVMGSRGSVIPLFIEQIKSNHQLTVTDPNMTRFIMSLDEAVDLVLIAFEHGSNGDIFVQKSPSSKIGDLAEAVKIIFNSSLDTKIIGTRHGEKKYEVLLTKEEASKAIDFGKYFRIPADNRNLNYEKYLEEGSKKITLTSEYSSDNTHILSVNEIVDQLIELDFIKEEVTTWKK
ncbi:MAG: polysaccharide biosynthesis protein [Firmicutes bacterium]|nr:polysaccharide biosynthesis protein [Bacillota bacterium]